MPAAGTPNDAGYDTSSDGPARRTPAPNERCRRPSRRQCDGLIVGKVIAGVPTHPATTSTNTLPTILLPGWLALRYVDRAPTARRATFGDLPCMAGYAIFRSQRHEEPCWYLCSSLKPSSSTRGVRQPVERAAVAHDAADVRVGSGPNSSSGLHWLLIRGRERRPNAPLPQCRSTVCRWTELAKSARCRHDRGVDARRAGP